MGENLTQYRVWDEIARLSGQPAGGRQRSHRLRKRSVEIRSETVVDGTVGCRPAALARHDRSAPTARDGLQRRPSGNVGLLTPSQLSDRRI